ncbi:acetolactate synthase 2, chloroplastic-like [Cornus florida]|uniref:acetolactate synthase 2, chloroplastic-like n=1 Tax=Cornus florida TaxID=4283 RepID=UPI00289AE530|nr:acetolactate synthase 2, chloroplastic-like [Cornus florida]
MAAIVAPSISKFFPLCPSKRFTLLPSISYGSQKHTPRGNLRISNVHSETSKSRFAANERRKGSDVLIEALERKGVTSVFAYQGGASMEIHQALTRSATIRNILFQNEQRGVFAAEGYARASSLPGVCIALGPNATNLISELANAMHDSIPIVAITGQVPRGMIGTDGFQETPIVEVTRSFTKHKYIVLDVEDIPRIVDEAFFLASSGRPGPVLIDIPQEIQQQLVVPNWDQPIKLPDYMSKLPEPPDVEQLEQIVRLISESERPVLYVGGGCLNSSEELRRFVELTKIPVASSLMGLGVYPCSDELSLQMLGTHGTVYANYAVERSDLLLAFGVRFDDSVTRKLETFASRAKIVHIDIDIAEIGKNKQANVPVCADLKLALEGLNRILERKVAEGGKFYFSAWRQDLKVQKIKNPLSFKSFEVAIPPQYAIQVVDELTRGNAIICTGGVGQHQMWTAQFYKYNRPRQCLTSGGLGALNFALPAAMGAAVARPDAAVVVIDDERSFMANVQELATIKKEGLPVKMMMLSNQRLGMVLPWEDPVFWAESCDIPTARVMKKGDVRTAIQKMLDTSGPYFLDVVGPYEWRGTFQDVITEGNGRLTY